MRAKKVLLILTALTICICGCGREAERTAGDPAAPTYALVSVIDDDCECITGELVDSLTYHTWGGVLWPGVGGIMDVQPPSWPKNCGFTLIVPHDALPVDPPADPDQPYEFSMSIPNYQEYIDNPCLPLIIRLEPSSIPFLSDIEIHATWMPLRNDEVLPIVPGDWKWYSPDTGDIVEAHSVFQERQRIRVHFFTDHFSDWGLKPRCDPEEDC